MFLKVNNPWHVCHPVDPFLWFWVDATSIIAVTEKRWIYLKGHNFHQYYFDPKNMWSQSEIVLISKLDDE